MNLVTHKFFLFPVIDGTASEAYSMTSAKSRAAGNLASGNPATTGRASNKKSFQRKISLTEAEQKKKLK